MAWSYKKYYHSDGGNFIFNILISDIVYVILTGKSTTASMLAYVLRAMGDDLTAVIGALVPQVSSYNSLRLGEFYFADTIM